MPNPEVKDGYRSKLSRVEEKYVTPGNAFYDAALAAVEIHTVDMTQQEILQLLAATIRLVRVNA